MKILKPALIGFLALIVFLSLVGIAFLPRMTEVKRSLVIQAPAEVIFDQVNDLKKNEAWSPWKDPTLKITYGSETVGKGGTYQWVSEKMGNGTMTITESNPSSSINIDLDFGSMGTAKAQWSFVSEGGDIMATQTMISDAGFNPVKRWMGLMTDKMVGPMFEQGLTSLKSVSEKRAAEIKIEMEAQQATNTLVEDGTPVITDVTPGKTP